MPRRVIIADRIIVHERVAVPGLRPLRGRGDDRVGGCEPSQRGVEPTSAEEVQSKRGFLALTGELVVRAEIAAKVACLAEGLIERGRGLHAAGIRGDRGTAEMVAEQDGQGPAGADGGAILKVKLLKCNCYWRPAVTPRRGHRPAPSKNYCFINQNNNKGIRPSRVIK